MSKLNSKMLVSGAEYFGVEELNPYEHKGNQPDIERAIAEHSLLVKAFKQAGIEIIKADAPEGCQDGIYTANWALCFKNIAIASSLPNKRKAEEPYARKVIRQYGYDVIEPPGRFSGQGDCLPCGNYLFVGSTYRTDRAIWDFLRDTFGCEIVGVETVPALDSKGNPITNSVTGWPDSYFYDLDLALAPINENLIAWCPEAFTKASRLAIEATPMEKIEVSLEEAQNGFACNLVSTGETVIMSPHAPKLQSEIESRGIKTITPEITELSKGGGFIRCCSLTLG